MALITARLEPVEPYDEATGLPKFWAVVTSKGLELRRFPGQERALAEIYATEFNIKAFEVHTRLRDRPIRLRGPLSGSLQR